MLSENDIKEELSYAYVHAVAARAGFTCDRPQKDRDSVDVVVSARGQLHRDALVYSPRIDLQLKATALPRLDRQQFTISLPLKNYEDLRQVTQAPRLLVVLVLPHDDNAWLVHDEASLVARRCAYWHSLRGMPPSPNETTQSVTIFRRNKFSPDALRTLMVQASLLEEIHNGV